MANVGCRSPIPSGTPLSIPERQGSKIHPGVTFGMSESGSDKDWSHLGLGNAGKSLGFAPETRPVGNPVLFPAFPWQTQLSRDGREGPRASNSMKERKFQVHEFRKEIHAPCLVFTPAGSRGIPVGQFSLEHPENPTPSHFFFFFPPSSHIQLWLCLLQIQGRANSLRIPVIQGIGWNLFWITRACLVCDNARSTVIPKETL